MRLTTDQTLLSKGAMAREWCKLISDTIGIDGKAIKPSKRLPTKWFEVVVTVVGTKRLVHAHPCSAMHRGKISE